MGHMSCVLPDTEDVSDEMSNLELELSSLVDLDLTSALNDGYATAPLGDFTF